MIWCSYRITGRSPMSIATTPRIAGLPRRAAPRRGRSYAPAHDSPRAQVGEATRRNRREHLAEQAYTSELARAARSRSERKPAAEPPLGLTRAVAAVRVL